MKLAAIVVLYQPNIPSLINNIISYIDDIDRLLIYRNSEVDISGIDVLQPFLGKMKFLGDGENVGIAKALNAGVNWVLNNKYSHLLTLDQDSFFTEKHLRRFKEHIQDNSISNVGIFAPNLDNRGHLCFSHLAPHLEVADTITSGSIFPAEILNRAGGFDEGLFIDAVDYEYCYRIKSKYNSKTIIFPDVVLIHEVGYPKRIRFGFMTDDYSPLRTYFIVRNHIIIWRRYPELFQASYKVTLVKIHIIYRMVKILIGENNKVMKLKAIVMGFMHGIVGKEGFYKL